MTETADNGAIRPSKDAPIVIIGARIFGLSTAIHAARRGYTNITVYDRQPYERTQYDFEEGCDAASAGEEMRYTMQRPITDRTSCNTNKIVWTTYGDETDYQEMCVEDIQAWRQWNNDLASGDDLPPHMTSDDHVFINNGCTSLNGTTSMNKSDQDSLANIRASGAKTSALVTSCPSDQAEAERQGLSYAIDPFNRAKKGLPYTGLLDTTAGYAVAHKACWLALHKVRGLGVRFVLGEEKGALKALCYKDSARTEISGFTTMDGEFHAASLPLVACGGWTPTLVPELDGLCDATAGSVAFVKIPRSSPLFERFAPKNFPTFID
jgi:sarcosine oxidase/L-pipecolate oxidase